MCAICAVELQSWLTNLVAQVDDEEEEVADTKKKVVDEDDITQDSLIKAPKKSSAGDTTAKGKGKGNGTSAKGKSK